MATVLDFPSAVELGWRRRHEKVTRAKTLIYEAAALLSDAGAGEARVAWLLEDCVELLGGSEAESTQFASTHAPALP